MTREEIINGLKMSIDLMLFDPTTGEVKEPHQLNDMNRTSYEAFKGAMEILAQPQTKCIAKITLSKEQIQDAVEKAKREILAVLPRWTPVTERLPEEKGEYLVTYHPSYWDEVSAETKVGIDSFRGKSSWAKKKYQRVTAWAVLPEPYEGGDRGKVLPQL